MRILKIEIEEFGKLYDRYFLFGEGINLIQGLNESGKSTLLAFIRFALYGFPRKGSVQGEEREMRLSWHTGRAAGRLFLRTDAGDFCISRSVVRQGSAARESFGETLLVSSLADGTEVALDGKTPGEYFLGLPATLYDSTLCLRQSDAARVSDPAVSEALSDLLFTGSTGVSADAAIERLRQARRELQHQKGRGGLLAELSDRIAATQEALMQAREQKGALNTLRADVARYRTQVLERQAELETVSAQLESVATGEALALFDRAHAAKSVCEQKRLNYEAVRAQSAPFATMQDTLAQVQAAMRERESARVESLQALPELTRLRAVRQDEAKLAANAVIEQRGGAARVLSDFRTVQQKKRRAARATLVLLLITLVFATVVGLIAAGVLPSLLSQLLPVGAYLNSAVMIGTGVSALFFMITLAMLWRTLRMRKRVRAWLKALGVKEAQMFRTYLQQCAAEAQSAEAQRTLLSELEGVYTEKLGALSRAEARVRAALTEAGLAVPDNLDDVPALLAQTEQKYREAHSALLAAKGEWERALAAWESISASLAGKNEKELRARFMGKDVPNPDELRRKQAFLRETLAGLEKKATEAERRESALSATTKDVAVQESELAALRAEHRVATRRLSALELALSALAQATQGLREGVIPQLCERASAHLKALTGGTYGRLYAGADLGIRLDSDKGPLPLSHFSAGCRDAAHLCLRLALLDTLSSERLPLLFDEAFSRLDDERAKALLALLLEYCRTGGQCLLFTCQRREADFLAGESFTHFELQ